MSAATTTATVGTRDGTPAVNVKDQTAWAHDHRTADIVAQLSASVVERIYEEVREGFWQMAEGIAEEHGYRKGIYSAGRSGGWLCVSGTSFLEYLDADDPWSETLDEGSHEFYHGDGDTYLSAALKDRDRFLGFAGAVEDAQATMEEEFVLRLRQHWADESNIERGES